MARPTKTGLDYFPLDTDIDQDDKVMLIESEHGLKGFAVLVKLLMRIYDNGYFYEWSKKQQLLLSKRINVDVNEINVIINSCIEWGFFDKYMLETYEILTSRGIQKRFLEATKRRNRVKIDKKYLLLDLTEVNVYKNLIIVDNNSINANINPQSKVKKSIYKEKEKEEDSKTENPLTDSGFKKVVDIFNKNIHPITPFEGEILLSWLDKLDVGVITEAVREAVRNDVRNIKYIEKILEDWHFKGLNSREKVEAYLRDYKDKKNKKNSKLGRNTFMTNREKSMEAIKEFLSEDEELEGG